MVRSRSVLPPLLLLLLFGQGLGPRPSGRGPSRKSPGLGAGPLGADAALWTSITEAPRCAPPLHQCMNYGRVTCFLPEAVCDGRSHCHDGSDEEGCAECKGDNLLCQGRCVPRCDGVRDCDDGRDELGCWDCFGAAVMCDGRCARMCTPKNTTGCVWRCNGVPECADGGDERRCGRCGGDSKDLSCGRRVEPRVPGVPRFFASLTCGRQCDGVAQCANGWDEDPSRCSADAPLRSPWD